MKVGPMTVTIDVNASEARAHIERLGDVLAPFSSEISVELASALESWVRSLITIRQGKAD